MQQFKGRVPGVKVQAVDTTGAGDAFVGGILNSLASDFYLHEVSGSTCRFMRHVCCFSDPFFQMFSDLFSVILRILQTYQKPLHCMPRHRDFIDIVSFPCVIKLACHGSLFYDFFVTPWLQYLADTSPMEHFGKAYLTALQCFPVLVCIRLLVCIDCVIKR